VVTLFTVACVFVSSAVNQDSFAALYVVEFSERTIARPFKEGEDATTLSEGSLFEGGCHGGSISANPTASVRIRAIAKAASFRFIVNLIDGTEILALRSQV
jgi:hypothetical protein